MSASCRSCGEPVIWAQTQHGKRMPVDAERITGGNLELAYEAPDGTSLETPWADYVRAEDGVLRHVSHFATCVDADKHRRS